MSLRTVTLSCHVLLLAALAADLLASGASPGRLALVAAVIAPLLLALPGLRRADPLVLQRLAVLLVPYVGGTSMEVVARAGSAPLISVALLAATLELGTLLAFIRRTGARPRAAPE
jgi:hypothetical protein